MTCKTPLLNKG